MGIGMIGHGCPVSTVRVAAMLDCSHTHKLPHRFDKNSGQSVDEFTNIKSINEVFFLLLTVPDCQHAGFFHSECNTYSNRKVKEKAKLLESGFWSVRFVVSEHTK